MYLTSISFSYFLLGVSIACIAAYLYFRLLFTKTSPESNSRDKIIGQMKDPETWRLKNKQVSNVCMFWFIVSILIYASIKFLFSIQLIPIVYLLIYVVLMLLSFIFSLRVKGKASI
ncbi:hypothetical protein JMF89_09945 [Clostridiaceae bacterium UIB06]|uniref:Uncharacterized protein n=1 Tax=Clostridium thailandense TaxID=2794346 RepID=A0A949X3Y9_9CLOT|nr:hypothetical protein [Clostridium thailandense]MBV7273153.1 hypothetical protein [Clostridium thailandense]MCH5137521.1 hypothetical protein [Clostridiaceae bacterium UIB06]